ncbi:hypothetical protein C8Q79DRAFT_927565 [Trametes meyenii]|nr:hypothetical protein C8Q79DRAFT_927565 [Trametes meyenii]
MRGPYSPGPTSLPGFLTPRSFNTLSPPLVHTPGAHSLDLLNELHEASISPDPIHEILRDPAVLSSLLAHRKKPRRASSSSHTPRGRGPTGTGEATPIPEHPVRDASRTRERSRDRESTRTADSASTASTIKPPRKEKRERERDRDRSESDSASILTHVLAEEERQARHLKAVLRQTGVRLEDELRRADVAESRARSAEITAQDLTARLAAADAARHQCELDAARAQEECRRWQMQADAAEREARRLQAELGRVEREKREREDGEKEARDVARRAEQTLREWKAREAGREEVRRMEVRRRATDHRDEGYEVGRADGYEAGRADGYEEGREEGREEWVREGYERGYAEGSAAARMLGYEEGKQQGYEEGRQAGYSQGRKEERARALDAFDRFIESEMDHRSVSDYEDERTQRWVEATRQMRERDPSPVHLPVPRAVQEMVSPPPAHAPIHPYAHPQLHPQPHSQSQPQPQPQSQPNPPPFPRDAHAQNLVAPQPVRAVRDASPGPPPKLVWLHRPVNRHQEASGPGDAARPLPMIPEQAA